MRIAPVALLLVLAGCRVDPVLPDIATTTSPEGVVVHLFEWRWEDVAVECETVLGPLGYAAVQVSPPTENHVIGGRPWWERYQPVSYRFVTRSGDRAAFADMVERCDAAGVDVLVDAVINHMTDADLEIAGREVTATGTAGTRFESYSYPGLYGYDDFHHCGLTPDDDIEDFDDPVQRTECELVDLADLDTGKPAVQATIAGYLRDLASLGVTGIRIDAARHMAPGDIAAILDSADWRGYVVSEVTVSSQASMYTPFGDVTDFSYGSIVSRAVRSGDLVGLRDWADHALPGDSALVFIDNHDNQRGHGVGGGVLTHASGPGYDLAVAFMLAYGRGRPRVMSSFAFESSSQGPPTTDGEAILPVHGPSGAGCGEDWVCEHRRPVIAGLVGFHNEAGVAPVAGWTADGGGRIAFSRGDRAFVALNATDGPWTVSLETGLPAGSYCDVAQGAPAPDGACAGSAVVVHEDGTAAIEVPPVGVVAIHVGALTP